MRSSLPQAKERQPKDGASSRKRTAPTEPKLVVVIRARVTPPSLESSKPRLGRLEPQVLSLRRLSLYKNGSRSKAEEPFVLRAQDWDSPIIEWTKVGPALDALASDAALNCVVMAEPQQVETLRTILAGTTKKHKVLLIQLHKDGKTRVPGRVGNLLQFRQGTITQINSTKEKCPQPVGMPTAGVAIKPLKMAVVYFRIPKLFLTEDGWKKLSHQPARAVAAWAASHHITLADSWGGLRKKLRATSLACRCLGWPGWLRPM